MSSNKITDESISENTSTEAKAAAASNISVQDRIYQTWQRLGMAFVLIVLCIIMSVVAPHFLGFRNLINVAQQISINSILAAGMTFVILTGCIDLSVVSGLAVAGVISVWLTTKGVPDVVAVLAGIATGGR